MQSFILAVLTLVAPPLRNASPVDAVVSAAWLNQHVHDRDLVILQVSPKPAYDKEHIPGARYVTPGLESSAMGSGATMDMTVLPTAEELRANLEKLGISNGSHVVVAYIGKGAPSATRVIYLMRYAGLENVSLLDGGMAAWTAAGFAVTADTPAPGAGQLAPHAVVKEMAVDYAWVQAHQTAPRIRIIDARDPVYFDGKPDASMGMSAGHIPGAHNIPYFALFQDNGLLVTPATIEAKFRAAGIQPGDTVVAYCHVGIQATTVVFSAQLIGQPVKMYVGSFHDWSARKLPTEGGTP
jgi:thiosulfate/3-mercaptopyruvate sulfurtransferase